MPSVLPTKLNNMTTGYDLPTVEKASTGDKTPTRDRAMGRNFMVLEMVEMARNENCETESNRHLFDT